MRGLILIGMVAALLALLAAAPAAAEATVVKLAPADTLAGHVLDVEITGSAGYYWARDGSDEFPIVQARLALDADGDVAEFLIALAKDPETDDWVVPLALVSGHGLRHLAAYYAQEAEAGLSGRVFVGAGVSIGGGKTQMEVTALWKPQNLGNLKPDGWAISKNFDLGLG